MGVVDRYMEKDDGQVQSDEARMIDLRCEIEVFWIGCKTPELDTKLKDKSDEGFRRVVNLMKLRGWIDIFVVLYWKA